MDIAQLVISGVVLASGGAVVYLLRDIPKRLYKYAQTKTVYSVTIYQNDELFDILEEWLFLHYNKQYRDVEASLSQNDNPPGMVFLDRPPQKKLRLKQEENFFIAKINGKSVFISKSKEKLDKAQSLRDIYYRKYILRGFRAKDQINGLLEKIVADYNLKIQKGVLKVYTNNSWGDWICINDITVKPFSKVVIPKEQKDAIVNDLDKFIVAQEWYKERGIRHKRSYLLHGSPGNGKTSIGMAIAEYLNRDIYVLNLNSLENDSYLIKSFSQLGKNIVLLVEDIDRAFSKRDNVESKISFSTVLNSFDGALCRDGIITVVTTNHIEQLDEALIRDGRIDMKQEIVNPSADQVKEYLELFYGIKIVTEISDLNIPMSSVQEFCIKNKENSLAAITHFSYNLKTSEL